MFDQYQDLFNPEIINWNYVIYKVIVESKKVIEFLSFQETMPPVWSIRTDAVRIQL